jgi:hypothetical protein
MMRKLRKLTDRTGWTVEDLINEGILEFVAKCQAKMNSITRRLFPSHDDSVDVVSIARIKISR